MGLICRPVEVLLFRATSFSILMQAVEEESVSRYVSSSSAHKDVPHAKKIDAITIGIRGYAEIRQTLLPTGKSRVERLENGIWKCGALPQLCKLILLNIDLNQHNCHEYWRWPGLNLRADIQQHTVIV